MDEKFYAMYEADIKGGRPSIAPEKLMRAMLLQVLYGVHSEGQLVEQLSYSLLFRWFVGLAIEDTVWNHSVFGMNRDSLIEHDAFTELFNATVEMARKNGLLSGKHFSVDGTLTQAWVSHKSMRRKDGSDEGGPPENWHDEKRSNGTHESKTDPQCRLYRKSQAARALPRYPGRAITDNLRGQVVNFRASQSDGLSELEVAASMLADVAAPGKRIIVGSDKAYDTRGFVKACRGRNLTLHVAQSPTRTGGRAVDSRTTRHAGYGAVLVTAFLCHRAAVGYEHAACVCRSTTDPCAASLH
jgi:transposase